MGVFSTVYGCLGCFNRGDLVGIGEERVVFLPFICFDDYCSRDC